MASTTGTPQRVAGPEPEPSCPERVRSVAEAEAYVSETCFRLAPPVLVGVELEWLLADSADPSAPVTRRRLAAALGPHAPTSLDPSSPALPLPAGSAVTVEPGGQVELATPPQVGLAALIEAAGRDTAVLHRRLARAGLVALPRAADPLRPPVRLLDLPRYTGMERYFDRIGPSGRSGMCATASVQICLDAGDTAAAARSRWTALHALGPVLVAAFANSPHLHGRDTGWKSSRMACWLRADPARTTPPTVEETEGADPAAAWARRVVHSPVMLRRGGVTWDVPEPVTFAEWVGGALPGPPSLDDLRYHVSTLFPPVRPRGYLEVRYVDAQPGRGWALPVAVLTALTSSDAVVDRVREVCASARGRWVSAARRGLEDPVLARAAQEVFELTCALLPGLGAPDWLVADLVEVTENRVARARCPADEPTPAAARTGPGVDPLASTAEGAQL